MNNQKFGNRSRDRKGSSRRSFGGSDSRRVSLHDAVCDECGKNCQVPFRPSGEKPIYCSDCFEKKGGRDSSRSRDRKGSSRRSFGGSDRSMSQLIENIEILNTKLDVIINLLSSSGKKKSKSVEGRAKKKKSRKTQK
jgi:CxxC-x17-CxxC domain-containing protein